MIIVVLTHIINMGYGITGTKMEAMPTFCNFFVRFYMPLFFFISGFVTFRPEREWSYSEVLTFLRHKFTSLVVAATLFMTFFCFLHGHDIYSCINSSMKDGYWFTFTLFVFLLIYSVAMAMLRPVRSAAVKDIILCSLAILLYFAGSLYRYFELHDKPVAILNISGIIHLRYFIFFCIGCVIKRNFHAFIEYMDHKNGSALCLSAIIAIYFVGSEFFPIHHYNTATFIPSGVLCVCVVMIFFYRYRTLFSDKTAPGKCLQYIGRRTLDIYFLHYFFLPRNLHELGKWFFDNPNPTLEFFVSLILAMCVIAVSLAAGSILRLSPLLAGYLLGVKKDAPQT